MLDEGILDAQPIRLVSVEKVQYRASSNNRRGLQAGFVKESTPLHSRSCPAQQRLLDAS